MTLIEARYMNNEFLSTIAASSVPTHFPHKTVNNLTLFKRRTSEINVRVNDLINMSRYNILSYDLYELTCFTDRNGL